MVKKIRVLTAHTMSWQETTTTVEELNGKLRGWSAYYSVGTVHGAYRALDNYTSMRLRQWLRHKHKVRRRGGGTYPLSHLYEYYGLVRLTCTRARRAVGEGVMFCPRAGCGKSARPVR